MFLNSLSHISRLYKLLKLMGQELWDTLYHKFLLDNVMGNFVSYFVQAPACINR